MNFKEFEKYYEDLNDKQVEKYGTYAEDFTWVDFRSGDQTVNFLDKFIKVFKEYPLGEILVDEHIGFICNYEDFYICEEFLDFCIKKKIYKDRAYYFYHKNLEDNLGKKEHIGYEESFKTFKE